MDMDKLPYNQTSIFRKHLEYAFFGKCPLKQKHAFEMKGYSNNFGLHPSFEKQP